MNHVKAIALTALLAFGCGGESPTNTGWEDTFSEEEPNTSADAGYAEPVELGQTAQALTVMSDGYGRDGGNGSTFETRCNQPTWFGTCIVPSDRKMRFYVDIVPPFGATIDFKADAKAAIQLLAAQINQRGWDVAETTNTGSQEQMRLTTLPAGVLCRGGGSIGNCSSLSAGNLCRAPSCLVECDTVQIESQVAGRTPAQKNQFMKNLWGHELGHCSGLGHFPGSTLMPRSFPASPDPFINGFLMSQEELGFIAAYRP
jgi:hypothetical protein